MIKYLLAATAALALVAPVAAQAQAVPSYAAEQTEQQIQGRVIAFDGAYSLEVQDGNGYDDDVQLHDGTIINPTGLTPAPGMVVSILGENDGSFFAANEIDTPYVLDAAVPYYEGHPWTYFGPSFSLGFFFGNASWWHRDVAYAGPGRFGESAHFGDTARLGERTSAVNNVTSERDAGARSGAAYARADTAPARFRAIAAAPARAGSFRDAGGAARGGGNGSRGHGRR